jgi:CO/xanthine dehydrogenase FAD-binding subunit
LRVGAGVTYARLIAELGDRLPGLAIASRTVGSPQIRNRGTVGGNLGTSSPAGDGLPPLFASDAEVELASRAGTRRVAVREFVTGPKRNCLADDELIAAFHVAPADGPQQFAKIGTRNAMVIAVCSLALSIWPARRGVAACIGSAGPTPIRCGEAEQFIAGVLDEHDLWSTRATIPGRALARFGELVEQAARPIDDVRGTARYRHHALGVLGRRTLTWAWEAYRCA